MTLLPSGRGFGRAVEGQVDDALGKSEKKTNGFFSKVGTGIKRVGLGIAAVAGTVATLAVTGGISRALNIEDAQAKLKGLGHDTKSVEAIMENALAAVKGTAFGLDAAATTAAAAVASGIKPGQELERYLRLTADAATIAGVSMEEMGSIINKVQAKGKAQMEDLNRLTERGIPIMQMLADEYGVTADEMSDMVSRGEVDAERFRAALEKNVGGAALASGDTTRGAFANMRAALSRLGLVFVEDALGGAKQFFNEVTVILDGLAERMRPWVEEIRERLSGAFQIEGFGDRFLEGFDRLVVAIQNGPIPQIIAALAPIAPAIGEAAAVLGGELGDALAKIGKALAPVLPEVAEKLADALVELVPSLADLLVALVPLLPPLADLLAVVAPLAADLLGLLVPAIEALAGGLSVLDGSSTVEEFSKIDGVMAGVGATFGTFPIILQDVISWFKWFSEMFTSVTESVSGALAPLVEFFRSTFQMIQDVVGGALQAIGGLLSGNLAQMRQGVAQAVSAIASWWTQTWSGLVSFTGSIWSSVAGAVSNGVAAAVSVVSSLPGRIMGALSGLAGLLVGVGRDMIQGLINGVSSMIQAAVSAVKNVGGAMLDGVKSFLGIHSPSRVFRDQVGKMVGLGLLAGIEDQSIRGRIDTAVNHMVAIPQAATSGAGASVTQNNTINMYDRDERLVLRQLGRQLAGVVT